MGAQRHSIDGSVDVNVCVMCAQCRRKTHTGCGYMDYRAITDHSRHCFGSTGPTWDGRAH